ncbi:baculoviral IAP repeat-containing protein 3-like [Gigantopelta aegis]|uniref:baculoviral IAP repeat-containing protein 3-like n=1 Tax=Gigantopelta aegis TaxID=1735272 RepID=UPI001B88D389|nr:baculoviral IAP repeat-containing protein 3-like [Gigantopelta aegis]
MSWYVNVPKDTRSNAKEWLSKQQNISWIIRTLHVNPVKSWMKNPRIPVNPWTKNPWIPVNPSKSWIKNPWIPVNPWTKDAAPEYKTDSAPYDDDGYDADDEWGGLSRHYVFCHRPEMRGFYRRLYTFGRWPLQMSQRPRELAKAGFFYTGHHDAVVCYCCGQRAYGWKKMDDPVMEHYRLSPRCPYINNVFRH